MKGMGTAARTECVSVSTVLLTTMSSLTTLSRSTNADAVSWQSRKAPATGKAAAGTPEQGGFAVSHEARNADVSYFVKQSVWASACGSAARSGPAPGTPKAMHAPLLHVMLSWKIATLRGQHAAAAVC